MTEWQLIDGHWVKRDDLYSLNGSCGGKVRTCVALASQPGVQGLVTAGSRQSPQVNIVATVGEALDLPVECHVPAGPETPELQAAARRGARIVRHRPGHNNVIIARARVAASSLGWTYVPFGMECQEAVRQTANQVHYLPPYDRLVVPVGSGMSLAGILHGLERLREQRPVLGVVVGADPENRLDRWAPVFWRFMIDLVRSPLDYHKAAPDTRLGWLSLDPIYEAKCLPYLEPGDALWVVGKRETAK